jgi:hypothetical protein
MYHVTLNTVFSIAKIATRGTTLLPLIAISIDEESFFVMHNQCQIFLFKTFYVIIVKRKEKSW